MADALDPRDPRLERARSGDGAALAELLTERAPALLARVARQLPDKWAALLDAEDVVQQTFTDAFLGIRGFDPVGGDAFDAWLWTLARHNIVDGVRLLEAHRRGGGQRPTALENAPGDRYVSLGEILLAGSITSPSMRAVRAERTDALLRAVEALPEVHRAVVEQYDLRGDAVEAVAERLNRSVGAVYLLRHRAHKKLRHVLLGQG